jgi:cytochrome c
MKALTALAIAAALSFSGAALASEDLAKKDGCFVCHDATAKKIGPTWKEIAAKLKGRADAEKVIEEAIAKGSKGVYGGKIPMPPAPKAIPDGPALAKWIMSH